MPSYALILRAAQMLESWVILLGVVQAGGDVMGLGRNEGGGGQATPRLLIRLSDLNRTPAIPCWLTVVFEFDAPPSGAYVYLLSYPLLSDSFMFSPVALVASILMG